MVCFVSHSLSPCMHQEMRFAPLSCPDGLYTYFQDSKQYLELSLALATKVSGKWKEHSVPHNTDLLSVAPVLPEWTISANIHTQFTKKSRKNESNMSQQSELHPTGKFPGLLDTSSSPTVDNNAFSLLNLTFLKHKTGFLDGARNQTQDTQPLSHWAFIILKLFDSVVWSFQCNWAP